MSCEGDGIAGYNSEMECYRIQGCPGCEKCQIKCEPKCENCPSWGEARVPEVGDFITVQAPILSEGYRGPKWTPAMDMAIGRTAWVAKGNPVDGFNLKFVTTKKEILDQYLYPLEALKLAMPNDNTIDKMIKTSKEGSPNEDM